MGLVTEMLAQQTQATLSLYRAYRAVAQISGGALKDYKFLGSWKWKRAGHIASCQDSVPDQETNEYLQRMWFWMIHIWIIAGAVKIVHFVKTVHSAMKIVHSMKTTLCYEDCTIYEDCTLCYQDYALCYGDYAFFCEDCALYEDCTFYYEDCAFCCEDCALCWYSVYVCCGRNSQK